MRNTFEEIINRKNFYRNNFRVLSTVLFASLVLNAILTLCCFYFKMTEPEAEYYASHPFGVMKLQAREQANYTNTPLLAPDPPEEAGAKRLLVG